MAKRIKKTTKRRKTLKSAVDKKKTVKKAKASSKKEIEANHKAHWKAYVELQKRVDKAWEKLQADVRRKASPSVLIRNKNELLLLLGECNYMARECMGFTSKNSK